MSKKLEDNPFAETLLKEVEKRPCLYTTNRAVGKAVTLAWKEIAKEIGYGFTDETCKSLWQKLRGNYKQSRNNTHPIYQHMKFLDEKISNQNSSCGTENTVVTKVEKNLNQSSSSGTENTVVTKVVTVNTVVNVKTELVPTSETSLLNGQQKQK